MNLQARKLELIEYLIQVNDEKIIDQIKNLIDKSNLTLFTKDELISRANQSELNFQSGKFKTQEQLEADSTHW